MACGHLRNLCHGSNENIATIVLPVDYFAGKKRLQKKKERKKNLVKRKIEIKRQCAFVQVNQLIFTLFFARNDNDVRKSEPISH